MERLDGDSHAATAATITLNSMANAGRERFHKTVLAGTATISFTVSIRRQFHESGRRRLKLVKITQLPIRHAQAQRHGGYVGRRSTRRTGRPDTCPVPDHRLYDAFAMGRHGLLPPTTHLSRSRRKQTRLMTSSFTKSILYRRSYTFTAADFTSHFSDTDGLACEDQDHAPSSSIGTLTRTDDVAVAVEARSPGRSGEAEVRRPPRGGHARWLAGCGRRRDLFGSVHDRAQCRRRSRWTLSKSAAEDTLLNSPPAISLRTHRPGQRFTACRGEDHGCLPRHAQPHGRRGGRAEYGNQCGRPV